jgi:hypothetical protein
MIDGDNVGYSPIICHRDYVVLSIITPMTTVRFDILVYVNLDPEPLLIVTCSATDTVARSRHLDEEVYAKPR